MDRPIKKELSEFGAEADAFSDAGLVVSTVELTEEEPGSVDQVTLSDVLPVAVVGGFAIGGGGVQRQPLELMTPANSAMCSSSNLLK